MYQTHECSYLPKSGVCVLYSDSFLGGDTPIWNLVIEREATEEDLESNHYLENVGDSIWQTVIEVYHCPFCGESLSKNKQSAQEGNFIHIDSSNWSNTYL